MKLTFDDKEGITRPGSTVKWYFDPVTGKWVPIPRKKPFLNGRFNPKKYFSTKEAESIAASAEGVGVLAFLLIAYAMGAL